MSEHGHRLEKELVARYEAIDRQQDPDHKTKKELGFEPECAAVPFIGSQFDEPGRKRILVYGSAENLTHLYEKKDRKPLDRTRHRDAEKARPPFRLVHIGPINNGGLLTVARYLLYQTSSSCSAPAWEMPFCLRTRSSLPKNSTGLPCALRIVVHQSAIVRQPFWPYFG